MSSVLVVDDEPVIRRLLSEMLQREGYYVLEAANGREAVEVIMGTPVALVLTDLVMPEQEGIETIRVMRRIQPNLKIIAMSGAFGGEFLPMVSYLGADGTLAKPLHYDDVVKTVRKMLTA